MARPDSSQKTSRLLILASVCVVVAALYFAQDVLIPLALAVMISFLLAPLVNRLEKWKIGRVGSVIIATMLAMGIVGGVGYVVWNQFTSLASDLPKYRENIVRKVRHFRPSSGGVIEEIQKTATAISEPATTQSTQPATKNASAPLVANPSPSLPPGTEDNPLFVVPHEPPPSPLKILESNFGILLGPLGTAGIVVVFTIFMLLSKEDLRDRLIRLVGQGQLTLTTQAIDDAATRISRYLLMQSVVNGTYGMAIWLGLWLIGVPNPALWGLLCAVLRFIPYVGPWIGASIPILLSIAVFPGMRQVIYTVALFVVIELISNNFMEPWLYGSSTGMSAVAILVSAVFWTWLWGPIGLLLSTPLTVILVVLGKYVPSMQFLAVLLGDEPVFSPSSRVYQRWLALDAEEAADVVHDYMKEQSLEEAYDNVVLPALALAEQDRHRGNLDDRRQLFIRQSVRDLIDELDDEQRAAAEKKTDESGDPAPEPKITKRPALPNDCPVNVLAVPAHDEADEIVALMLAQLLELQGYCAVAGSTSALASEMLDLVEKNKTDIVCISALPPAAVSHARYLCKRLHGKFEKLRMVIGLWTMRGDLNRARERIGCEGGVLVITTLREAMDAIHDAAQPLLMRTDEQKKSSGVSGIFKRHSST